MLSAPESRNSRRYTTLHKMPFRELIALSGVNLGDLQCDGLARQMSSRAKWKVDNYVSVSPH